MSRRRYDSMAERLLRNSIRADLVDMHECNLDGDFCWLWLGRLSNNGYPTFCRRVKSGPRKGKPMTYYAHRESLRVFKGVHMGRRYVAKHLCNVRSCINPEHLANGSQKSNVRQCVKDGRHRSPIYPKGHPNHV